MAQHVEHDPDLAPAAEAIHLPEPSYMPATLAFGIALALIGILTLYWVTVIGVIIVLVVLVRWIRSAREEMSELPLEHH
jgi:Flp pilus assembly protein TadB